MIKINIDKAKQIAHQIRRDERAKEFAPLDELIAKQIPGVDLSQVHTQRDAVREKYAQAQTAIDAAADANEIKEIVLGLK